MNRALQIGPAGCSNRPDFSPAQPWRAETRLIPSKAATSEEGRRTLRYVEPLSEARTMLADFFNILLEAPASAPDYDTGEEHGGRQEDDLQIEQCPFL